MTSINRCSSNAPLQRLRVDKLPLELRSKFLWPFVVTNGDRRAASQVCKAFDIADICYLQGESSRILQEAKTNSGLYSSIKRCFIVSLETRESLFQFHEFIVQRIRALGGGEVAVLQRPLTAEEVQVKHEELQDRALEKFWGHLAEALLKKHPELPLDRAWKASEIRIWMNQNPKVLQEVQLLRLAKMELAMLPVEIAKLENLALFFVGDNKLRELPEEISVLTKLRGLNATRNQLSELPEGFHQLTTLVGLGLADNHMREFPEGICELPRLRDLDVSGNQLGELPPTIGQLTNLKDLNISNNHIGEFPFTIGQFANLTLFKASQNQLTGLPEDFCTLPNLREVNIAQNRMEEVPRGLTRRRNLNLTF